MSHRVVAAATLACVLSGGVATAQDNDFGVYINDVRWRNQTIPEGQQCRRDGGNGASPRMIVGRLPAGTNRILLEFNDRTDKRLDKGGMGRVSLDVTDGATGVGVPSIPGHSFELPSDRMRLLEAHRGDDVPGAYLPPCSGGLMHLYTVRVMAAREEGGSTKVLAEETVVLGYY